MPALLRPLTPVELEIVECIGREMPQPEIADWLGVKRATIRWHVHNISEALTRRGTLRGYLRVWVWVHRGI